LTLGLTVVGIAWQFKNIAAWVGMHPLLGAISGTSVKEGRTGRSQYLQSRSGDPVFFNRQ
jgi:hypothetical protein